MFSRSCKDTIDDFKKKNIFFSKALFYKFFLARKEIFYGAPKIQNIAIFIGHSRGLFEEDFVRTSWYIEEDFYRRYFQGILRLCSRTF